MSLRDRAAGPSAAVSYISPARLLPARVGAAPRHRNRLRRRPLQGAGRRKPLAGLRVCRSSRLRGEDCPPSVTSGGLEGRRSAALRSRRRNKAPATEGAFAADKKQSSRAAAPTIRSTAAAPTAETPKGLLRKPRRGYAVAAMPLKSVSPCDPMPKPLRGCGSTVAPWISVRTVGSAAGGRVLRRLRRLRAKSFCRSASLAFPARVSDPSGTAAAQPNLLPADCAAVRTPCGRK